MNSPLNWIDPSGHDYALPRNFDGYINDPTGAGVQKAYEIYAINQFTGYDNLLNDSARLQLSELKGYWGKYISGGPEHIGATNGVELEGYFLRNDACSYLIGGCEGGTASFVGHGNGHLNIALTVGDETHEYTIVRIDGKVEQFLCNCFTAGTMVETDQGEIPIEEIKVGDKVLAKDDVTGEVAYKEVEILIERTVDEVYNLTIGNEIISTTEEHPF